MYNAMASPWNTGETSPTNNRTRPTDDSFRRMELRRFLISSIFILLNFRIPSLYSRSSITYSEQLSGIIILGTLCWSRKNLASLAATLTTDLKNGPVRVIIGTCGFGGEILSEVWGIQEKARRVLQAATVEAY